MKIRNGFVSNSSTSSYILVGWCFQKDEDNWSKLLEILNIKEVEEREDGGEDIEYQFIDNTTGDYIHFEDEYEFSTFVEKRINKLTDNKISFDWYSNDYDDIGPIFSMGKELHSGSSGYEYSKINLLEVNEILTNFKNKYNITDAPKLISIVNEQC